MNRRAYLASAGALIGGLAGCMGQDDNSTSTSTTANDPTIDDGDDTTGDGTTSDQDTTETVQETQTGTLTTAVSDDPKTAIGDFEKLLVTVKEVWVHPKKLDKNKSGTTTASGTSTTTTADGEESGKGEDEGAESTGKIRIPVNDTEVDLVKLQGDAQSVINETDLPTGTYAELKLWVGDDVTGILKDGSEAHVETPGNAPLKFTKSFEIRPDTKTTFVADFAPHARGKNAKNGYIIKPVATAVSVSYTEIDDSNSGDDSGSDSGSTGTQTTTQSTTTESGTSSTSTTTASTTTASE